MYEGVRVEGVAVQAHLRVRAEPSDPVGGEEPGGRRGGAGAVGAAESGHGGAAGEHQGDAGGDKGPAADPYQESAEEERLGFGSVELSIVDGVDEPLFIDACPGLQGDRGFPGFMVCLGALDAFHRLQGFPDPHLAVGAGHPLDL